MPINSVFRVKNLKELTFWKFYHFLQCRGLCPSCRILFQADIVPRVPSTHLECHMVFHSRSHRKLYRFSDLLLTRLWICIYLIYQNNSSLIRTDAFISIHTVSHFTVYQIDDMLTKSQLNILIYDRKQNPTERVSVLGKLNLTFF